MVIGNNRVSGMAFSIDADTPRDLRIRLIPTSCIETLAHVHYIPGIKKLSHNLANERRFLGPNCISFNVPHQFECVKKQEDRYAAGTLSLQIISSPYLGVYA